MRKRQKNRSGAQAAARFLQARSAGPRLPRKLRVGARPAHGVVVARPLGAQAGNPGSENGQRLISAASA